MESKEKNDAGVFIRLPTRLKNKLWANAKLLNPREPNLSAAARWLVENITITPAPPPQVSVYGNPVVASEQPSEVDNEHAMA